MGSLWHKQADYGSKVISTVQMQICIIIVENCTAYRLQLKSELTVVNSTLPT